MFYPDDCHKKLAGKEVKKLSFETQTDLNKWKRSVKRKLTELLGLNKIKENACEPNFRIIDEKVFDGYKRIHFEFESENYNTVPCWLLIPDKPKKSPLAVIVQGHSPGAHLSLGELKYPSDPEFMPRCAQGIQAIENGFAALVIEQRGLGSKRSDTSFGKDTSVEKKRVHYCAVPALTAINLGRSLIGERVWDVSRSLDILEERFSDKVDMKKIVITGNSGGGTASYYCACLDKRISVSAPSCAFCTYEDSVMKIEHCACNYVYDIVNWFEMGDLACLIAPRNLIAIAGKVDDIFPIEGVKKAYAKAEKIYKAFGAEDKCRLVITEKGHWWCEDVVWKAIREVTDKEWNKK